MTLRKCPSANAREVVVIQLALLRLINRNERAAVSIDAATRADLIELMARVVVTVFHEEKGSNDGNPVQPQSQTGALGPQGDCVSSSVER